MDTKKFLCVRCVKWRPISELLGDRYVCKACNNIEKQTLRKLQKARRNGDLKDLEAVYKLAQALTKARNASAVRYLLKMFMTHVGQPEELFRKWHRHLLELSKFSPGDRDILVSMRAILQLYIVHNKAQTEISDTLTEQADVQRVLELKLRNVLLNDPEVVLQAAAKLGWTVLPPPDALCDTTESNTQTARNSSSEPEDHASPKT